MSILKWPASERPREKLLERGAEALSDAELLAIFLRTGVSGKDAVSLARELLAEFGGLRKLFSASKAEFCRGHGLGVAKYTQLQAVLEMSSRYLKESMQYQGILESSDAAKEFFIAKMKHLKNEVFSVLFLNNSHQMIAYEELFFGSINNANVHPRVVVQRALHYNAAAVIFAHNHPSGNPEPSRADIEITFNLMKTLKLFDVRALDHLIIGDNKPTSLAERGLVKFDC